MASTRVREQGVDVGLSWCSGQQKSPSKPKRGCVRVSGRNLGGLGWAGDPGVALLSQQEPTRNVRQ